MQSRGSHGLSVAFSPASFSAFRSAVVMGLAGIGFLRVVGVEPLAHKADGLFVAVAFLVLPTALLPSKAHVHTFMIRTVDRQFCAAQRCRVRRCLRARLPAPRQQQQQP